MSRTIEQGVGPVRAGLAGVHELAPRVSPAGRQHERLSVPFRKGRISDIAVALHDAAEVHRDDLFQDRRRPVEGRVAPGLLDHPEEAVLRPSAAGQQVLDRRFIKLRVVVRKDAAEDHLIEGPKPFGGRSHPAGHVLAGQVDAIPPTGDLLLPVERQMVAVFRSEDRGEKTGPRLAAFQHRRQLRDDRGTMRLVAPDVAAADDPATDVSRRLIVQLPGDLFVDLPPRFGLGAHFLGIEDDFHAGQRVEERLGDASFGFALPRSI